MPFGRYVEGIDEARYVAQELVHLELDIAIDGDVASKGEHAIHLAARVPLRCHTYMVVTFACADIRQRDVTVGSLTAGDPPLDGRFVVVEAPVRVGLGRGLVEPF